MTRVTAKEAAGYCKLRLFFCTVLCCEAVISKTFHSTPSLYKTEDGTAMFNIFKENCSHLLRGEPVMARLYWNKWPRFRFSRPGNREDVLPIGSCSKDDRDGNENVTIKRNRSSKQNNNFARAARFFVHFFAVTARIWREIRYATLEEVNAGRHFFPLFELWIKLQHLKRVGINASTM